ncbi:MAG: ATP-binding cassette domain-containing protein [Pyrinomonadaceae bacterium]|nr:ATP-binding cassette domain-containing protein [Phycisphaerales bacterium]
MNHAISIKGLTKTFGPKVAVKNLDLVVPTGSLCGFIGRNGAGKTTTIRMIMSILFPDSGELTVLGKKSAVESKDQIGYLPEERGLYRKMKVLPFITYMAKLKGVDSGAARHRAMDWLERVELSTYATKKCEELSKGMQQKVQFISSVIHDPELIILDEPFSGLDPVNLRLLRDLILDQNKLGKTIIFSTHAMHTAEELCDHLFMINLGKKVLDSSMRDLWAAYDPRTLAVEPTDGSITRESLAELRGVRSVEIVEDGFEAGLHDDALIPGLMAAVLALGPVRRIELKRPKLEDIFTRLAGPAPDEQAQEPDT